MAVTRAFPESASEFVGPYRLHGHLGRGGMGEVYEGYDERLDRPVALKRIRPGSGETERARRRFSREARALARLVHPAIVQVYDWVETEDGNWIVMELVEGRSLRDLLADGPLAPGRAARLACHVLEGLAVAHAAGVVHRDLKAENVMVVRSSAPGRGGEQAKILDFGLAKRYDPATGESQVSVDGGLVGTASAMSPEQVLGRAVGPRSDLFSLGSLLYEMTTGVRPFDGGAVATIAYRICTLKPRPAREVSPAVPAALSAFIDRLLEKDPRRRPASAGQAVVELEAVLAALPEDASAAPTVADGPATPRPDRSRARGLTTLLTAVVPRRRRLAAALTVLVLVLAALGFGLGFRGPSELRYVAVPATRISVQPGPAAENLELAAGAVRTALLRGLLGFRDVAALEPAGPEAAIENPVAMARAVAADEVLASRLECGVGATCRVVLSRLQSSDGRVLQTRGFTVETDRLLELSLAVVGHLGAAYPDLRPRRDVSRLEVRAEDYDAYLRLWRRFEGREEGLSSGEMLTALESLQRTSPRFLPMPLLEAQVVLRRFREERDPADLEHALKAIGKARSLAPDDPQVLLRQAQLARAAGRLDEAAAALETLRRLEPGSDLARMEEARVLEEKGASREAIALAGQVVRRRPSAANHFTLADMLYRNGDVAAARRHLEAGLERSPKNYDGRSRLAQIELLSGSPERAARLYEELIEQAAGSAELSNLGTAYLLLERYEAAARRFREALALAPSSVHAALNLADAELLRGRREAAADLYLEVLRLADQDPNSEALLTVRAQALAHLGRTREAVAAVQEALRRAPDHPGVAYEAALVYTLLGDEASALWNVERALGLGVEPGWFAFPWFAPLRDPIETLAINKSTDHPFR